MESKSRSMQVRHVFGQDTCYIRVLNLQKLFLLLLSSEITLQFHRYANSSQYPVRYIC